MGLDELKSGNTKRAKDTAISVFMAFVKCEQVEFDYVKRCIAQDATGKCSVSSFSVDAAEVFFVRFIRMKTPEEQGLSLFPDAGFVTCPLHAVAIAHITRTTPSVTLIDNLPAILVGAAVTLTPATPQVEVLNHPEEFTALAAAAPKPVAAKPKTAASVQTVYSHANRLLDRVALPAVVVNTLTSHSFRRGDAQHVNGCHRMMHRWIFDRGWNMSTTNKGFNYIFNTNKEDHVISKALSGYSTEADVKAMNLTAFDAETMEKINAVQRSLFTTCYKMESSIRWPCCRAHGGAAVNAEASVAELLAWLSHLAVCGKEKPKPSQEAPQPPKKPSNESRIIEHQSSVIDQLLQHIVRQDERMDNLEAKMEGAPPQDKCKKRQQEPSEQED
ncbi:unnamed protein product [Phytophthora fragariaefolia]|uniref:Unnamed protein product n=1 Tax=Phytophthora fragariaefolia TaxID=1490495 RepID=A0A9W6X632_9STRA|nr:unnamed protein product [Phytophthora fragariaefolia]